MIVSRVVRYGAKVACCVGVASAPACSTGSSPTTEPSATIPSSTVPSSTDSTSTPPTSTNATSPTPTTTNTSSSTSAPADSSNPTPLPSRETSDPSNPAPTETDGITASAPPADSIGEVSSDESPVPSRTWVLTVSSGGPLRSFEWDAATQRFTPGDERTVGSGPNEDVFVAMAPGSTQAFVVTNRAIAVYDFDPDTGAFSEGPKGTTQGTGTFVSVSPGDRHVYVAHYNDNALSYLTYDNGAFSTPQRFNAGLRAHSAQESKNGGWVLVPCLGSNYVAQYRRDGDGLAAATPPTVALAGGPRHFAFHPTKPFAYVLTELSGELGALEFSETSGLGKILDTEVIGVQSNDNYWGSDVKISPDGNHVFAVERNAQKLYHFDVSTDGTLQSSGTSVDLGGVVRAFDISTDGRYLFLGNSSGQLVTLAFDADTNTLTPVPNPPTGLGTVFTTLARDF